MRSIQRGRCYGKGILRETALNSLRPLATRGRTDEAKQEMVTVELELGVAGARESLWSQILASRVEGALAYAI